MTLPQPNACYIGVDHEPADYCNLLRWLAAQLGAPPPRVEASVRRGQPSPSDQQTLSS